MSLYKFYNKSNSSIKRFISLWYRTYQQLKHQQAACTCTEDTSFCWVENGSVSEDDQLSKCMYALRGATFGKVNMLGGTIFQTGSQRFPGVCVWPDGKAVILYSQTATKSNKYNFNWFWLLWPYNSLKANEAMTEQ